MAGARPPLRGRDPAKLFEEVRDEDDLVPPGLVLFVVRQEVLAWLDRFLGPVR